MHEALPERLGRALRSTGGALWLAFWALVLHGIDRPWRELGGLLSERMRWTERFVLGAALIAGCLAGSVVRDATRDAGRSATARQLLRRAWLLPSASVAVVLVWLELRAAWPSILLVLAGWLGYWSGLDAACWAWPLLRPERVEDLEDLEDLEEAKKDDRRG